MKDPRLASLINAPGIRTQLVPIIITAYRGGELIRCAGQRFTLLVVQSIDAKGNPRALAKFSLN